MTSSQRAHLIECVVCTTVFAVVFGITGACGDGNRVAGVMNVPTTSIKRVFSYLTPTAVSVPGRLSSSVPLVGMAFQTSQQEGAAIQQSFQALGGCGAFQPGSKINWSGAATGLIPLQVLADPFIIAPNRFDPTKLDELQSCAGVFAQVGGGANLAYWPAIPPTNSDPGTPAQPVGGTWTNPGTPIYTDGTLSALVVTGRSVNGQPLRCSDLTHTAAVHDADLVQPYFVIQTNSVLLAVGSTQSPLTCTLNVPAGDEVGSIAASWAKI